MNNIININIGILGHIDSGKTSLVRSLSSILSTNALDKNPQSQLRGITLDLGFSSFQFNPTISSSLYNKYDIINCTLVDCPGHASLIKTIIGGASIIDMMLLVIDITKGIQTQTAECIVIGEILTTKLIIVLNKIDLLLPEEKIIKINKITNKITKIFSTSRFNNPIFVYTSTYTNEGIDSLLHMINNNITEPIRDNINDPFYYLIDHCFGIKGHGTVLTGTVLSGNVNVNDNIEIPNLLITKKVKSMQIFKKTVKSASQGDRVALCVSNLDPKSIERGIATSVGLCSPVHNVLCLVKQIRFYKNKCKNNTKFHISVGHQTVLGSVTFFGYQEINKMNSIVFDLQTNEFMQQDELVANNTSNVYGDEYLNWAVIQFQSPIYCLPNAVVIASKLDIDCKEYENQCRIAFYGPIKQVLTTEDVGNIKIYNYKYKEGVVQKVTDTKGPLTMEVIGHQLINENASLLPFIGMKIEISGENYRYFGYISSIYGSNTSGKFKVKFIHGIPSSYVIAGSTKLLLKYKRYTNDKSKAMIQTGLGFDDFDLNTTSSSNSNTIESSAEKSLNDEMMQILTNKVTSIDIDDTVPSETVMKKESESKLEEITPPPREEKSSNRHSRSGIVESVKTGPDGVIAIVTQAFKMEENIKNYAGFAVYCNETVIGEVLGPYAKLGKCKIKVLQEELVKVGDTVSITI